MLNGPEAISLMNSICGRPVGLTEREAAARAIRREYPPEDFARPTRELLMALGGYLGPDESPAVVFFANGLLRFNVHADLGIGYAVLNRGASMVIPNPPNMHVVKRLLDSLGLLPGQMNNPTPATT